MKFILRSIPNVIVFTVLIAVFCIGQKADWKVPKFSELTGGTVAGLLDADWCGDHLVPESQCIECKPNLLPKGDDYGYCKEHGVAQCVTHHPESAQINGSVSLPKYDTAAAVKLIRRQLNNPADTLHLKRVQFASRDSVDKSGVKVDIAGEGTVVESLAANGELIFDPNSVVLLSSKVQGTLAVINKIVGDKVKQGEVLALVDASQVGLLKSEFIKNVVQLKLQRDNVARLQPLVQTKAISAQEMLQAGTAFQEAEVNLLATRQQFANLGFILPQDFGTDNPEELAEMLRHLGIPEEILESANPLLKNNANLIPLTAPFDGVVITSEAVRGKIVEASVPMFTVCDPDKLWIMLDIRQEDAGYIHTGLKIEFASDNSSDTAAGTISWISPQIDEKTRTLKIRAEVDNENGKLRSNTFGSGKIILREEQNAILVPVEAIQSVADSQFVFVRDKDYFKKAADGELPHTVFYPRQVVLGAKGTGINAGKIEILAGVLPGEVIATKGSGVLLAHLLRANLGAGCCAED